MTNPLRIVHFLLLKELAFSVPVGKNPHRVTLGRAETWNILLVHDKPFRILDTLLFKGASFLSSKGGGGGTPNRFRLLWPGQIKSMKLRCSYPDVTACCGCFMIACRKATTCSKSHWLWMGLGEVLQRKGNKTFQCGMGLLASYSMLNCFLLVLWHVRFCETQECSFVW